METILEKLPYLPDTPFSRERLAAALAPWLSAMEKVPQNPLWHGEGDVLTHTIGVCRALVELPAYGSCAPESQLALYLAALMHDVGKIQTTILEDGHWAAPGHAAVSASVARRVLWQELGLCGTPEKMQLREHVCSLIRYHSLPLHGFEEPVGILRLMRFASNGELIPGLSVRELCILAESDIRGRICGDAQELLDKVHLCAMLAEDEGCLTGPYPFPDAHTAAAYLSGRNISAAYPLFNDSWSEAILMSGLPGTGKDTWIRNHCPEFPVVSLDDIRHEFGISPNGPQDTVVQIARERAKEYLRKKQPFIWNATNITPVLRKKQVDLFTSYGAATRIVYLEAELDTLYNRNASRKYAVPETVIGRMLDKISPPERREADWVEWIYV